MSIFESQENFTQSASSSVSNLPDDSPQNQKKSIDFSNLPKKKIYGKHLIGFIAVAVFALVGLGSAILLMGQNQDNRQYGVK